ncbi:MAG: hypothetical protein GQ534_09410 [Candidatus Delongbacteria bacterium]|nr:hypothetical protein [Candidatus Delongbacteria bacterium]
MQNLKYMLILTVVIFCLNLSSQSIFTMSGDSKLFIPESSVMSVDILHVMSNDSVFAWGPSNVPNVEIIQEPDSYVSLNIENFMIGTDGNNKAILTWTGKQNATRYNIYRDITPDFSNIDTLEVLVPFFTEEDTSSNKYFYYISWEDE